MLSAVAEKCTVEKPDGKTVSFDADRIGRFDHGYRLTADGSKGLTLETWRISHFVNRSRSQK